MPVVTLGSACTTAQQGKMGVTATGTALVCLSNVWTAYSAGSGGSGGLSSCSTAVIGVGQPCQSSVGRTLIYVGNNSYTGIKMFADAVDDGGIPPWSPGAGSAVPTTGTSWDDGLANTAAIIASKGVGVYAAYICASKGSGWYLPALRELISISSGVSSIGGFRTWSSIYWSSTDQGAGYPYAVNLSNASSSNSYYSTSNYPIRCVRRD